MSYCHLSVQNFYPDPEADIAESLFKQYERVVIESLITSFGLDFLIKDKHGGDVDTIHNVRQIGSDERMTYKNKANEQAYENRSAYNSEEYHKDAWYREKNKEISEQRKNGTLTDAYTGEQFAPNGKSDLDHVISAHEIHHDKGRVLAGVKGTDLANSDENLKPTNPHTNRTKKADSMHEFIDKHGDEYSEGQKTTMQKCDQKSREAYEQKLSTAYYTSPQFMKDVGRASAKVGAQMGIRQVLGFIFAEMWFSVKEEFAKAGKHFDLSEFFTKIGNGITRGFENAKLKYKEIIAKFLDGGIAGALASITTTICNIFFTTAKNVVKIIRQSWVSLVEAAKIIFINPDNLPFGERIRAVVKIIATGASIVLGTVISEAIAKTPIGQIPVIGEIVSIFCGTLTTGIMSCTLLYFFDRSEIMNKLVGFFNSLDPLEKSVAYFRQQAECFERYAAELMKIDLEKFREEVRTFTLVSTQLESAQSEDELNSILNNVFSVMNINKPWGEGDFDTFMMNRNSRLVFE
jgi:hypothetical protein